MSEKIISFNFDKKQAIVLCKQAISSKMSIIRDGGDALQCGAPPDITFNVLIADHEIKVSGGGPGAYLAETAAKEIEKAVQEYQRNPGAAMQRRRAPQQAVQSQPPRQQQRIDRDDLSPAEYLELLSKGGDAKTEEKVASSNQSVPANSPQTSREDSSYNSSSEEPAYVNQGTGMATTNSVSMPSIDAIKCEKMIRVSKIVCMVIFITMAFFSFLDIVLLLTGRSNGEPMAFMLFGIITVGLSVPMIVFLSTKKLSLFAIFGFIMINPAIYAAENAIWLIFKFNLSSIWILFYIAFVVFGIILLVNFYKLRAIKKGIKRHYSY